MKNVSNNFYELAISIESQLYEHPEATLMKIRLYFEQLVKRISEEEGIEEVYPLKNSERIHKLYRQNAIEKEVYEKFEWVRKKGNKAAHDMNTVSMQDALKAHRFLFDVSVWYMQVFISYDFEAPNYRLPQKEHNHTAIYNSDMNHFIKPYLEQAFSKIDNMRTELNSELKEMRNELKQTSNVDNNTSPEKTPPVSAESMEKIYSKKESADLIGSYEKNESENQNQDKVQPAEQQANIEKQELAVTTDEDLNITGSEISDNLTENESEFEATLQVLQSSSKESVVNANLFGELRNYMHVERDIQKELENILVDLKDNSSPSLILLCGSVGDGKSHLLAYMKENHKDLMQDVIIHNDSTESYDPDKSSLDTLEQVLAPFDEGNEPEKHIVIAINLGVLHNFYSYQRKKDRFQALCNFIDRCGVFEKGNQEIKYDDTFYMLNFADSQPYVLTENGPKSPFFLEIMDRVTEQDMNNPFYRSWSTDYKNEVKTAAHYNYFLLQQKEVKESIVQSLIEVMVKKKVFISTRAFYNFLYEIIVPIHNPLIEDDSLMGVNDMLPSLMYGHPDRSRLLAALNEIDPLKRRLESTDQLVGNFLLKTVPLDYVKEELGEKTSIGAWKQVNSMHKQNKQIEYSRLFVRQHALLVRKDYEQEYREFIQFLYSFYKGEEDEIGRLFELIEKVVYTWKGSPKDRFVFVDSPNKTFRLAVEIDIEPEVDEQVFGSSEGKEEVERFTPSIRIGFSQKGKSFLFELDYKLYALLKQINEGYRPNRQDRQDALQFSEFHDQMVKSADKKTNVLLVHRQDGTMLEVKKPRFSKSKYEVGKVK